MNLHELKGTVTAVGQSAFDNDIVVFAYVEITDPHGERTMIEKVAVCNEVGTVLEAGLSGTFYVDRIFRAQGRLRCQLFGIKTAGRSVFDGTDLRRKVAIIKILVGLLMLPVAGLGLLLLLPGLHILALSILNDRRRFFFGAETPAIARVARI